MMAAGPLQRAARFCERFGLGLPILQAPMAGACPPALAVAVTGAGGMGGAGVLLDEPDAIAGWVQRFREGSQGAFQLNIWVPDPPDDDAERIEAAKAFLDGFGTPGSSGRTPPSFADQCEAMLAARPTAIASIMGTFEDDYVRRLHEEGIAWFACATNLEEALLAQEAGADVIVAQGMEAGGHRGTFDPGAAERIEIGLFALLPYLVDRLDVPVVAAGGIGDGRGVAAALALGASAVQVGTALLRTPEAGIAAEWAASLEGLAPDATVATRAYSGRLGRAVATQFVQAWAEPGAPTPAPYPHQRRLVAEWRRGDSPGLERANFWAGQSAALARQEPAAEVVSRMWEEARSLLA